MEVIADCTVLFAGIVSLTSQHFLGDLLILFETVVIPQACLTVYYGH